MQQVFLMRSRFNLINASVKQKHMFLAGLLFLVLLYLSWLSGHQQFHQGPEKRKTLKVSCKHDVHIGIRFTCVETNTTNVAFLPQMNFHH